MNYFCTLFNKAYLAKGLAMITSLEHEAKTDYTLYVLAMDQVTLDFFAGEKFKHIKTISLADFENEDLLRVKQGRGVGEYCWTCTSALLKYTIETFELPECTYLDADLYFFNDPELLLQNVKKLNQPVMITPHQYTWFFDQTQTSGIFCVQFMYFKNTPEGKAVLNHWYEQCIEWCFARVEDGKFGDQKYLDVWPTLYPKDVYISDHFGTGAPWSIQRYDVTKEQGRIYLSRKERKEPLVFYHFHGLSLRPNQHYFYGWYPFSAVVKSFIYVPYVKALNELIATYNFKEVAASTKDRFLLLKQIRLKTLELFYWVLKF